MYPLLTNRGYILFIKGGKWTHPHFLPWGPNWRRGLIGTVCAEHAVPARQMAAGCVRMKWRKIYMREMIVRGAHLKPSSIAVCAKHAVPARQMAAGSVRMKWRKIYMRETIVRGARLRPYSSYELMSRIGHNRIYTPYIWCCPFQ